VLIFASELPVQKPGNCRFQSRLTDGLSAWLGWNALELAEDLSQIPVEISKQPVSCQPVRGLGQEAGGLVSNPKAQLCVTTYTGRIRDRTGIVVATSRDMYEWGNNQMLLEAPLTRRDPDCAPVYRHPSLKDRDALKFAFETIEWLPGDRPADCADASSIAVSQMAATVHGLPASAS
jgi:hypothetical protein